MNLPLRKISAVLAIGLWLTGGDEAQGQMIQENFDYPAGSALLGQGGWTLNNSTTNPIMVTGTSLTYPGLEGSGIGNAVALKTSGQDLYLSLNGTYNTGTVYLSGLVNFSSVQTAGDYFFLLNQSTGVFPGKVLARKSANEKVQLGLNKGSAGPTEYADQEFELNETYLVVLKYTFVEGPANDIMQLFVNPTLGAAEPVTPLLTLSQTPVADDPGTGITAVGLRQGSASAAPAVTIDAIKVGVTWASVISTNTTPPTLVSSSLEKGETGVPNHLTLDLTFSEPVLAGTGNYVLSSSKGNITVPAADASYSELTATIRNLTLLPNTTYTVMIENTAVKDKNDNFSPGTQDNSFQFTTGPANPALNQLVVENFNFTSGTSLGSQGGWQQTGTTSTNPIQVTSPGLTFSGLAGSGEGNSVAMTTTGQDVNKHLGMSYNTGSLYTSFLVNFSDAQTAGDYFYHFNLNSNPTNTSFPGKVLARRSANGKVQLGVNKQTSIPADYAEQEFEINQTHLVVMKYTFVEGAENDMIELFVNPVPGSTEPAQPLVRVTLGAADPSGIAAVGLRQGSSANAPTQTIDAIKVGTTWESVTMAKDMMAPTVVSFTPANKATNVPLQTDLVLGFSETVLPGNGQFSLVWDGGSMAVMATDANVVFSGSTVTIKDVQLQPGITYSAQIDANAVQDADGNFFAGITGATWTFSTVKASVSFANAMLTKTEGEGPATVTLNISPVVNTGQEVKVKVAKGQGVTNNDYTLTPTATSDIITLSVPANAGSVSFNVTLADDQEVEMDEMLTFTFEELSGRLMAGNTAQMVLTMQDNDKATVVFASPNGQKQENEGAYTVNLTLDKAVPVAQTITLTTTNGAGVTYGATEDYTTMPAISNGKLAIIVPAGATSASFEIIVVNDGVAEANETIQFELTTVGDKMMVGTQKSFIYTIVNDDAPLSVKSELESEFHVSPNPTAGETKLQLPSGATSQGKLSMTVYSSHGSVLVVASGSLDELSETLGTAMTKAPVGLYVVRVIARGQIYQTRLIKK